MADETVMNKKLLLISLGVGVLAVVLFFVYESIQQSKAEESTVKVLKWNRDIMPKDKITAKDIGSTLMSAKTANTDTIMKDTAENRRSIENESVKHRVYKEHLVLFGDFIPDLAAKGILPREGKRAYPLPIDPATSVGALLRPNSQVDLIGMVNFGKGFEAVTVVQDVRILDVGGKAMLPDEDDTKRTGSTSYRTITIEVTPKLAEQLTSLLPRLMGKLVVVPRPAEEMLDEAKRGVMDDKVAELLKKPLVQSN